MPNLSSLIKSIRDIMREDRGLSGDGQRIEQLAWMLFLKIMDDKDAELELLDDDYVSPIPHEFQWRNWAKDEEGLTGEALESFIDGEKGMFKTLRELSGTDARSHIVREVFKGNNNYMKSGTNLRRVVNKLNGIDFNKSTERHLFGEIYEGILKGLQSAGAYGEFYTPRAVTQFMTDMIAPKLGEVLLDPACGTGGFLTCAVEALKAQASSVEERQSIGVNVRGWEWKPLPYVLAVTNLILHDIELPAITERDALDKPLSTYSRRDQVDIILANPPFGGTVANNNEENFPLNYRTKESADLFLVLMMHLLKDAPPHASVSSQDGSPLGVRGGGRAAIVLPDGSLTGEGVKQRIREKWLTDCNLHTIIRLPNSVFSPYATVATNLLFFDKGQPTKEIWYYEHRLPEGQKSYSKTKPIRREEFQPIEDWWHNRTEHEQAWKVDIETIRQRGFDLDIKNPNSSVDNGSELSSLEIIEKIRLKQMSISKILDELKSELTV